MYFCDRLLVTKWLMICFFDEMLINVCGWPKNTVPGHAFIPIKKTEKGADLQKLPSSFVVQNNNFSNYLHITDKKVTELFILL